MAQQQLVQAAAVAVLTQLTAVLLPVLAVAEAVALAV
jgi:hypothetical protein